MTEWWQLAWEARALLVTSLLHAHHDGDGGDDDGDDGESTTNNHAALPTVTFTSSDIFHKDLDKDRV